jgi:hypothetical protein
VIAFGIWVESESRYASVALPGLRACAGPDSPLLESRTDGCIFEAYNEILEGAAEMQELEALVLLRDDVQVRDAALCDRIRSMLAGPRAGLVGVAGARHVTSLRWWEADEIVEPGDGVAAAHVVDGGFMVLAPDAVRLLRFDRRIWTGVHGYESELSFLTRAARLRVEVADLDVVRHSADRPVEDASFLEADLFFRMRWSHLPEA